jgi:hypothetical protein
MEVGSPVSFQRTQNGYSWYGIIEGEGWTFVDVSRPTKCSQWEISAKGKILQYCWTLKEAATWLGDRRTNRPRDGQRQKVYNAENAAVTMGEFVSFAQQVVFVREVESSTFWQSLVGYEVIEIKQAKIGADKSSARYSTWSVTFAQNSFHRSKHVVLHEMAHLMTYKLHKGVAGHGPEFCGILIELTREFRGDDIADKLIDSFHMFNVKYDLDILTEKV